MTATDHTMLLTEEIEIATAQQLIVVARCLAKVHTGARLRRVRDMVELIDLTVVEIWRYPGLQVDEIDPPHAARVILTGTGSKLIQPGHRIEGANPTTS